MTREGKVVSLRISECDMFLADSIVDFFLMVLSKFLPLADGAVY